MKKNLEEISNEDDRYCTEALKFVYDGLQYTIGHAGGTGHISGQVLCQGLKNMAIEKWGKLAKLVLENWNIKSTRDFGEIVYLMVLNKWMSVNPDDKIEDFDNVYDFKTVFEDQFEF